MRAAVAGVAVAGVWEVRREELHFESVTVDGSVKGATTQVETRMLFSVRRMGQVACVYWTTQHTSSLHPTKVYESECDLPNTMT